MDETTGSGMAKLNGIFKATVSLTTRSPPFFLRDSRASETRAREKITPTREKATRGGEREK